MFAAELGQTSKKARNIIDDECNEIFDVFKETCRSQASKGLLHAKLVKAKESEIIKKLNEDADSELIKKLYERTLSAKLKLCGFLHQSCKISKKRKSNSYEIYMFSMWSMLLNKDKESNFTLECSICSECKPIRAIQPCGHMACNNCIQRYRSMMKKDTCPFCRNRMDACMALYN